MGVTGHLHEACKQWLQFVCICVCYDMSRDKQQTQTATKSVCRCVGLSVRPSIPVISLSLRSINFPLSLLDMFPLPLLPQSRPLLSCLSILLYLRM